MAYSSNKNQFFKLLPRITFVCSDFVVGNLSLIVCHTLPDISNLCTSFALGGERVHVKLDNPFNPLQYYMYDFNSQTLTLYWCASFRLQISKTIFQT